MRCPTNQANRFAFGGILGICLLIAASARAQITALPNEAAAEQAIHAQR